MTTTPDEATKTAHIIEEALFKLHKDTNMKYKAKYRTLIFNLRDTKNKVSSHCVEEEESVMGVISGMIEAFTSK